MTYVLEPEVPGGFGEDVELDTSQHPPVVSRLHLEFAGWDGDHVVESFPCFLVTEQLAAAMVSERLSGFAVDDVTVTLDKQFVLFFPDTAATLPRWRWLRPGSSSDDDVWVDAEARLHVSQRALDVLRQFPLSQCEITPD